MGRKSNVQMKNYGQTKLSTIVKKPDRVGIVVAHAKLELAEDTNPVNVDCSLELLVSIGIARIHRRSWDEPLGIAFSKLDHIVERDSHARWVQSGIVRDIHLAFRYFPTQQPGFFDT